MVAERWSAAPESLSDESENVEDKDQLSMTDARVECVVEEIMDDHVLRVTDNAV